MSNDIILKAPDYAYKAVDIYKVKLKKIGSFRDKFKRFFSNKNDKAKEINEIQIKLKTYGKELQELCLKYCEDKKFRDEVQKVLKICKKLFKSFGIKDDITDVGVQVAYGSLIKELIPRYISLINEAIEKCKKNSEGAGDFVNKITSYYSKIRSSLAKIEYKDEHIAKLLAVFDALGMFFCRIHWENVTKSQKEVIESLVKKRTYLERMKTTLKMGRIDWKEAYEGINENVRNEEKNFDEQVKKWKKIQYFSKDKLEESRVRNDFFHAYWQDETLEENARKFKCKFTFDENTKNDIETIAESEVTGKLLQVCIKPNTKSECEEIMENSFKELFESIKGREMFERSCKEVYIVNKKLGKEAIKDACTMYDAIVKKKSLGNYTSGQCEFWLEDSGCNSVFDFNLGKKPEDALELAKELWKSRGNADVKVGMRGYLFGTKTGKSMRVHGAISV